MSAVSEKLLSAAIRVEGRVYRGFAHCDALFTAWYDGAFPGQGWSEETPLSGYEEGFLTASGNFVSRSEVRW